MKRHYVLANSVLWAAAILAAALLKAPNFYSLVLLPTLATLSLFTVGRDACLNRSDVS
ncbi:hypothetical protein [Rhodanobacter denitrificans]|uniref:hypothetical protein n=1 Tax=Rhodanobacter denitrificans TaxID=666685 RepID=UPI001F2DE08E|nr:hypothetical protein [Rhodanobacter denitrificans]UJJ59815.1 hypothetical protein LRK55_06700 [Rhodanobacter denitrificans]